MPIGSRGAPVFLAGFGGPHPMADYHIPANQPPRYTISGVTRDSTGAILGGVTVDVFETESNAWRARTVSDPVTGAYSVDVTETASGLTFYTRQYLAGAPDVRGTSDNGLTGTAG